VDLTTFVLLLIPLLLEEIALFLANVPITLSVLHLELRLEPVLPFQQLLWLVLTILIVPTLSMEDHVDAIPTMEIQFASTVFLVLPILLAPH